MADKTPKDMTDEELAAVIAEAEEAPAEVEPEVKVEEPEVPEPPVEKEEEEEPEPVVEAEEEEEKPPSRRENLRIQQVLAKLKESQQAPQAPKLPDALDYGQALDADPELIKKLQADRDASTATAYQRGIEQANTIRFHTRLEIDAPRIEAKYPQLDKANDKFNPVLANAINSMYLSSVGYDQGNREKNIPDSVQNPDIRYSDYVESIFELASEIAGESIEASTKNIKKQAANTGLRPDGSSAKGLDLNKTPNAMTNEELELKIQTDLKALGLV